jgi:hypothetical protein
MSLMDNVAASSFVLVGNRQVTRYRSAFSLAFI